MTENTSNANSEGVTEDSEESPINPRDLIANALNGNEQPDAEVEETEVEDPESEVATEESDATEEDEESNTEESENESDEQDVLSQIDFEAADEDTLKAFGESLADKMTAQQAALISQFIGSKGGSEYGKMRSELKKAKQMNEDILSKLVPADNQYASIKDEGELQTTETNISQALDYYQDRALRGDWDSNDDGDEGIKDGNGKFWTREQVAQGVKDMHKQIRDIDKQRQRLKDLKNLPNIEASEFEKAESELGWLKEKEGEKYKEYAKLAEDPQIAILESIAPNIHARLKRIMAHAVNSMQGGTTKKVPVKLPLKSKAHSASNIGSGAQSGARGKSNKQLSQARNKISSGNYDRNDVRALIAGSI